ncbi:MAG: transposase [Candidatus Limnocylindria bacterium]
MPAPYPLDFRREAVALLKRSGKTIPQLAAELGVSPQSLRTWAKQIDVDEGRAEGLSSEERAELQRLRRELRTVTEEREILRKRRPSSPRNARPGEDLPVHRREEGRALDHDHVPGVGGQSLGAFTPGRRARRRRARSPTGR